MRIIKEFRFEASHQLPPEKEDIYGVCSRLHGHSYRIRVAVQGKMNEDSWIMNLRELSNIVKAEIIDICDHQFLNEIYPEDITTAENLGLIWARKVQAVLVNKHPGINLHTLEVWETAKCGAIIELSDIQSEE